MADPLAHVSAGDPISATGWNQIVDSLRRANERDILQGQDPSYLPLFGQRGIIQIKNNSGGACGRFNVLGISGSLFTAGTDTFKQFPRLTGITPATGTHEGKFCVLLEPLASGAVGLACASGVTVAKVYVNSTSHEWADVKDADITQLNSQATATGCQIVSVLPSTGSQWAVVRIGNKVSGIVMGKLDGSLAFEGTATLSIWTGAPLADSGENITVYDRYLTSGDSLAAGIWCKAEYYCGRFYVTTAQCPAA